MVLLCEENEAFVLALVKDAVASARVCPIDNDIFGVV
jgi:hypothetical protein